MRTFSRFTLPLLLVSSSLVGCGDDDASSDTTLTDGSVPDPDASIEEYVGVRVE